MNLKQIKYFINTTTITSLMPVSNFDKNFERHKGSFKQKFGIDWNTNPELYVQYLQTVYISSLTEIANEGLKRVLNKQNDSAKLLELILKKISAQNG